MFAFAPCPNETFDVKGFNECTKQYLLSRYGRLDGTVGFPLKFDSRPMRMQPAFNRHNEWEQWVFSTSCNVLHPRSVTIYSVDDVEWGSHRLDGPANGVTFENARWLKAGKLHRTDGSAWGFAWHVEDKLVKRGVARWNGMQKFLSRSTGE